MKTYTECIEHIGEIYYHKYMSGSNDFSDVTQQSKMVAFIFNLKDSRVHSDVEMQFRRLRKTKR